MAVGVVGLFVVLLAVKINCGPVPVESSNSVGKFDEVEFPSLFEGDIAGIAPKDGFKSADEVTDYFVALEKNAKNGILQKRWPNNRIPYAISSAFTASERQTIVAAFSEINARTTALNLVARTSEANYVSVTRGGAGSGCYSYVGMIGGAQMLNLQPVVAPSTSHCITHGIIMHEMLHAIGFYHEQARTDRDQYVEVNWGNIEASKQHNFNTYSAAVVTHFGQPYDYQSLMHYGNKDFATNSGVWTIRGKAPNQNTVLGQRSRLSATDIAKMNAMYPGTGAPVSTTSTARPSTTYCARVYGNADWTGPGYEFGRNTQLDFSPAGSNMMSSLIVTHGCSLTLYLQNAYLGHGYLFRPTSATANRWSASQPGNEGWNDKTRSGKCTCP